MSKNQEQEGVYEDEEEQELEDMMDQSCAHVANHQSCSEFECDEVSQGDLEFRCDEESEDDSILTKDDNKSMRKDANIPVVYMLWCNDGSLYTGWTNHLAKRLTAHNAGTGGKYTRSRLPVALAWYQECDDKISAMQLEYKIKHKMTRKQKLALISKDKEL